MSKCRNCNITVLDNTDNCPLCHHVLETDDLIRGNMYPDARVNRKKFRLFENLVLFISIVVGASLLYVNYVISKDFIWSSIVILALIYGNVLIRLAIIGKSGYMFKTIFMTIFTIIVFLAIDYITGYRGWAINYVFPTSILLIDIAILILMIVNRRNWQSYMIFQILMVIASVFALILLAVGIIDFSYLSIIAFGFSSFIFLGTLIIGDQRARTELYRRFHI